MKTSDSSTKRILVVEDEPAICAICCRVLTNEGLKVDVAVNGKVAQDMIEKKQYDFCLTDIKTPEINGKELYQWLQEKHPQLAKRVIFTSGSIMAGDTMTFIERSGKTFLPKPFTPDELKAVISEALKEVE